MISELHRAIRRVLMAWHAGQDMTDALVDLDAAAKPLLDSVRCKACKGRGERVHANKYHTCRTCNGTGRMP